MYNYSEFIGKVKLDTVLFELNEYLNILKELPVVKNGSYCRLDEYESPKMDYVHNKLHRYKFSNGKPEKNTIELKPMAAFWWNMYSSMMGTLHTFPFLHHHASSWERQQVDIFTINCIINELKEIYLDESLLEKVGTFHKNGGKRFKIKSVYDYSPQGCTLQLIVMRSATFKNVIECTTEHFDSKIY